MEGVAQPIGQVLLLLFPFSCLQWCQSASDCPSVRDGCMGIRSSSGSFESNTLFSMTAFHRIRVGLQDSSVSESTHHWGSDGRFWEGTAGYCFSQEDCFVFPDGACSHIHDWLVPLRARLVLLVTFRRIREVGDIGFSKPMQNDHSCFCSFIILIL